MSTIKINYLQLGYIIVYLQKLRKRENLERGEREEEHLIHGGKRIRIASDFFSNTMQIRRWSEIFKLLKEKTPKLEFCIQ